MANILNIPSIKAAFADKLMGDEETFSMENRLFNIGCFVTMVILFFFIFINIATGFWMSFWLCAFIFICEIFFYYYARFKKQYKGGIIANALISYAVIIANYFINAGITGPTMFLFFLTFILLIAATPSRLHFYWLSLHIILGCAIIILDIDNPGLIKNIYTSSRQRYIDTLLTAIITLIFTYVVTRYLRNYYIREKQRAEESQTRLKAFFESTTTCYFLLNASQQVMHFNNAAAQFVHRAYHAALEENTSIENFIPLSYRQQFGVNYTNAMQGMACTEEKLLYYEGYGSIWLQFSYAPVVNAGGNITGVSFSYNDITVRQQDAEKINEHNNTLLTIAFLQSHELRQPVSSILGLLNLIKDDTENKAEYLQYLQDAVEELNVKLNKVISETTIPV